MTGVQTCALPISRKSFESATAALKSFAAAKTPTEFMKLQSDYMRQSFDSLVAELANAQPVVKTESKTRNLGRANTALQADAIGISVPENALQLNDGTIHDSFGNNAVLTMAALDQVLPTTWSRGNPVDIIGDAPASRARSRRRRCF